jgi:hypothetical protein
MAVLKWMLVAEGEEFAQHLNSRAPPWSKNHLTPGYVSFVGIYSLITCLRNLDSCTSLTAKFLFDEWSDAWANVHDTAGWLCLELAGVANVQGP